MLPLNWICIYLGGLNSYSIQQKRGMEFAEIANVANAIETYAFP